MTVFEVGALPYMKADSFSAKLEYTLFKASAFVSMADAETMINNERNY